MLFGASGVSYAAADHMQKDEYAYNLEAGRRSPISRTVLLFIKRRFRQIVQAKRRMTSC